MAIIAPSAIRFAISAMVIGLVSGIMATASPLARRPIQTYSGGVPRGWCIKSRKARQGGVRRFVLLRDTVRAVGPWRRSGRYQFSTGHRVGPTRWKPPAWPAARRQEACNVRKRQSVRRLDSGKLRSPPGALDLRGIRRRSGTARGFVFPDRRSRDRRRQRGRHAGAGTAAVAGSQLHRYRPQSADARLRGEPTGGRPSHPLAEGRCTGAAVRRCHLRSRLLPVRRDVLSRSPMRIPRGKAGAQARWTLPVQRVGSHRGQRIRERCHERPGGAVCRRSPTIPGAHAARLPRHHPDPSRPRGGGICRRCRRDPSQAEPRTIAARAGCRLLPGHPASQRDRSQSPRQARGCYRPCRVSDREPVRNWRSRCQDPGAHHFGRRPDGASANVN